jgi:hypothetical protein
MFLGRLEFMVVIVSLLKIGQDMAQMAHKGSGRSAEAE